MCGSVNILGGGLTYAPSAGIMRAKCTIRTQVYQKVYKNITIRIRIR